MSNLDQPLTLDEQIIEMKKYITFLKKVKMRRLLSYAGYYRVSRYGKYILSNIHVWGAKPNQEKLINIYEFDVDLRKLLFTYCKKSEVQFD